MFSFSSRSNMKECTTDIADAFEIPDPSELAAKLEEAIDEEDKPSLVLMQVLYDGEKDEGQLLWKVASYLVGAAMPWEGDPENFSADPTHPQIIDYLAAKGPYFAIMFQKSNAEQARVAFQNVRKFLTGQSELQGVDVKAKIATYQPGQSVEDLFSAAEQADLQ